MDNTSDTLTESISCEVCMKEVPASVAKNAEGTDYVAHFCGLECYDKWKRRLQSKAKDDFLPDE